MSDADSECWSDVDNFPPLKSLVKNCLNMKPDKNVTSSHPGNAQSLAKFKLNLSKAMDKNKFSSRISDDFMVEFGSDLEKLNENLGVFSKSMFGLLENCAKTKSHITSIAYEITGLRQQNNVDGRTSDGNE